MGRPLRLSNTNRITPVWHIPSTEIQASWRLQRSEPLVVMCPLRVVLVGASIIIAAVSMYLSREELFPSPSTTSSCPHNQQQQPRSFKVRKLGSHMHKKVLILRQTA